MVLCWGVDLSADHDGLQLTPGLCFLRKLIRTVRNLKSSCCTRVGASALATRHWSAAARCVFHCRALSRDRSCEFRTFVSPASFSVLLEPVIGAPLLSHLQKRIWITRVASELVCLPVLLVPVLHARPFAVGHQSFVARCQCRSGWRWPVHPQHRTLMKERIWITRVVSELAVSAYETSPCPARWESKQTARSWRSVSGYIVSPTRLCFWQWRSFARYTCHRSARVDGLVSWNLPASCRRWNAVTLEG